MPLVQVVDNSADDGRTRAQLEAQGQQVESLHQYADTARLRYDNGYTSYLEVLDAERSLFQAELQYTQTQQKRLQATVNLYRALGGGWPEAAGAKNAPEAAGTPEPDARTPAAQ